MLLVPPKLCLNKDLKLEGAYIIDEFTSTNAKERAEFIKKFYEYVLQNDDNFEITWSQWLKTN
jgi:hypothetical protein